MNLTRQQIDAISNLGLAHIGDGVWELLCRSFLCAQGEKTVSQLHHDTISMVKAPAQADIGAVVGPVIAKLGRHDGVKLSVDIDPGNLL